MIMYQALDVRLRPPYKSFATTAFYEGYKGDSEAARQHSMELMIKEMDENGIALGVAVARESKWGGAAKNEDLPGLLAEYGDRFIGAPHIQYGAEISAAETIDKYITNGACKAVYMEPGFRFEAEPMHADDKRLYPVYEILNEKKIPLLLQYGGGKNSIEYTNPVDVYHIAQDFPDMNILITHGGWPQVVTMLQVAFALPNVYLSPDLYMRGYPGSQEYVVAANGMLKDRLCFGSAYPLTTLKEAVDMYLETGIKRDYLPDIMYNNAAKFLRLNKQV